MNTTTTTHNPLVLAAILGVIAVVFILFIVMAIRRREIVFDGEVIDKNIIETQANNLPMNNMNPMVGIGGINITNRGGVEHEYKIKVKTSSGKVINYKISSGMYDVIQIGDMVSKPKGTTEVTVTSSKGGNGAAPTSPIFTPPAA